MTFSMAAPSQLESLDAIQKFVESVCHKLVHPPLDDDATYKLMIAVHEITTNVICHAHKGRSEETLRMNAEVFKDRITIRITYRGPRFHSRHVTSPSFDGSREDGFGLYIASHCVDAIAYSSNSDGTQSISLTTHVSLGENHGSDH